MSLKQIIAIVITISVMIFGVVYFTGLNPYFSKISIDIKPPITLASGAVGIGPYFESEQEPKNVVGLRYKFRVNDNQSSGTKIIFGWKRFYNPGNGKAIFFLRNESF